MGKFLLVILIFAALVYGVLRLLERRRGGGPARPRKAAPHKRVVGPDDDEEFLRELRRRGTDPDGRGKPDRPGNGGG